MKHVALLLSLILLVAMLAAGCSTTDNNPPIGDSAKDSKATEGNNNGKETSKETNQPTKVLKEINLMDLGVTQYNNDVKLSTNLQWGIVSGYHYDTGKDIPTSKVILFNTGTGETKIIDEGSWVGTVDISKNGDYFLYSKLEEEVISLYLYDGEKSIKLSNRGIGAFSPDSSKIVFTEYENGILLYDIKTATTKLLSKEKAPWYPVWFPDNTNIFYFADMNKTLGDGAGQLEGLATINSDTINKDIINDRTGKFRSARWIIPGEVLHILAGWDDGASQMILDLNSGSIQDLGEDMQWLSGGYFAVNTNQKLLYVTREDKIEIYKGLELMKEIPILDQYKPFTDISFSLDGEKMVFISGNKNEAKSDLWVADKNGENAKKITEIPSSYYNPQWISNDRVMVVDNTEKTYKIIFLDVK